MSKSLKFYMSPNYTISKDGKVNIKGIIPAGKFFYSQEYSVWELFSKTGVVVDAFCDIIGMTPDAEIFELTDE
jgi:hypothetical protein